MTTRRLTLLPRVFVGTLPAAEAQRLRVSRRVYHSIDVLVRDADGPRFVAAFSDAWTRLPDRVRRRLLAYWRRFGFFYVPEIEPPVVVAPTIQLAPESDWLWQHNYADVCPPEERRPFGLCSSMLVPTCPCGVLTFNATACDEMPPTVLTDVIVHELTHVWLAAIGFTDGFTNDTLLSMPMAYAHVRRFWRFGVVADWRVEEVMDASAGEDVRDVSPRALEEAVNDDTMMSWGFDPKSVDEWALATGRVRVLEDTPQNFIAVLERRLESIRLKGR
jgi:hypothetical protein